MAAAAALPMDPVWLGPVGEQGQEAHHQETFITTLVRITVSRPFVN